MPTKIPNELSILWTNEETKQISKMIVNLMQL